MKKIIFLFSALVLLVMSSCGKSHSDQEYKAVYNKVEKGEELTQDDFTVMLDYLDDAWNDYESTMKNYAAAENSEEKHEISEKFRKEWPYFNTFVYTVSFNESELNESNKTSWEKIDRKGKELEEECDKISEKSQKN